MKIPSLLERFENKFYPEPNTGCWLWIGGVNTRGYGIISIKNRSFRAHRVSWELYKGPIGEKLFVCHKCDTPLCVNPDHLFLGTAADNMQDCSAKGRFLNQQLTYCPRGHEYSVENTYKHGNDRHCRVCHKENERKYRANRTATRKIAGKREY